MENLCWNLDKATIGKFHEKLDSQAATPKAKKSLSYVSKKKLAILL